MGRSGLKATPAAVRRYSDRQIRRTLSKYETRQVRRTLATSCELQMTAVGDVDALVDRMIEREGRLQRVERFPYWAELWPTALAMAQWFCHAEEPIPRGWACETGLWLGASRHCLSQVRLARRSD